MLSLLSRLARSRPRSRANPAPAPDVAHLEVVVYTRADCGCCTKALDLLEGYRRRHRFALRTVDVDSDPELAECHGRSVPVVAVGGKVRFRGVVNPSLFERLLEAEGRGR